MDLNYKSAFMMDFLPEEVDCLKDVEDILTNMKLRVSSNAKGNLGEMVSLYNCKNLLYAMLYTIVIATRT